jgi:Flp pilus assembly protein TadG
VSRAAGRRRLLPGGDGGFFTIWMLGVCLLVLAIGGVSVDLWHAFSQRQQLAGVADAAALAGAAGIDPAQARAGTIVLDPELAAARAEQSVATQPDASSLVSSPQISFSANDSEITVTLQGTCSLFLLRFLTGRPALTFTVSSSARPRASS